MQQNYFISLVSLNVSGLIVDVIAVGNPFVDIAF